MRASAAHSLGLIGREGRGLLGKLAASDASVAVRAEACAALTLFSDSEASAILASALKDKSARVRVAAAKALAKRAEPASSAALKALLANAPPAEMTLIARAGVAEHGAPIEPAFLALTLGQGDPEFNSLAARAVATVPPPEAVDLLARTMRTDASRAYAPRPKLPSSRACGDRG